MDDFAASIADATDNCDTPSADCADAADAETADAAAAETAEAEMKAACSALWVSILLQNRRWVWFYRCRILPPRAVR